MKNLKISHQLLGMVALLMVAFASVTYSEIHNSITAIYHERYDMLRKQVESANSVLKSFQKREAAGELADGVAQPSPP